MADKPEETVDKEENISAAAETEANQTTAAADRQPEEAEEPAAAKKTAQNAAPGGWAAAAVAESAGWDDPPAAEAEEKSESPDQAPETTSEEEPKAPRRLDSLRKLKDQACRGISFQRLQFLLVTLILGAVGGHRIYYQNYKQAIPYLLFAWTGIPAVVAFIEFIIYAALPDEEFNARFPEINQKTVKLSLLISGTAMLVSLSLFSWVYSVGGAEKIAPNRIASVTADICRQAFDDHFAQHKTYPASLDEIFAVGCSAEDGAQLYIFSSAKHYVIVGLHAQGSRAYLHSQHTATIQSLEKTAAKQELQEAFSVDAHQDGIRLISQQDQ